MSLTMEERNITPSEAYPGDKTTTKAAEPELLKVEITGDRYTSKEFKDQEWTHMWRRVWMIAGMADDCAEPGDFFTCDLGHEPLLFVRGKGGINGFYNICQHRGAKLVLQEKGSMDSFSCIYHGWKYGLEGELIEAQDRDDFERDPCVHVRLADFRTEIFAGFVWYCLDDDAPGLDDFLGDMKEQLESWQLNDGFRVEHFTVELPCNWKVVIDNFQEGYHIRTLHPQLMETVNENKESVQYDLYDGGHSRMILLGCDPSPNFKPQNTLPDSITHMLTKWDIDPEAFKDRHGEIRPALQKSKRDKSAERGKDFSHLSDAQLTDNFLYDLFPSCALSVYPEGEYVWLLRSRPHPDDPEKCLFDYWTIAKFPEGEDTLYWEHMDMTLTRDAEIEHKQIKWGEESISFGIDQDVDIAPIVQQGMRSHGFKKAILCHQERRVQFLHDNIDRYIKGMLGR
ncbi:MAG: SRPBCC family protein [Pseudomonadota bacterium]|nr:SRPBCC family protein [Pseudomonadota bacterium]